MKRRWPGYLVPLKHDYPLGWRCASVLDEITDEGVTIKEIAHRAGLDYYGARQAVRRLERRGLTNTNQGSANTDICHPAATPA
jgi:DNA-binding MarR family transcriptional regulator